MIILELTTDQLSILIKNALNDILKETLPNEYDQLKGQDQILTVDEAANFLKLRKPTIYDLVSKSKLPVCKRGNRLYFSKVELTEWIKTGRKKTVSEMNNEAVCFSKAKVK